MKTFTIDTDNNITAFATREQAAECASLIAVETLATEKELARIADTARLVAIWNSFAGVVPFDDLKPVKKFTDRPPASTGSGRRSSASKSPSRNSPPLTRRSGSPRSPRPPRAATRPRRPERPKAKPESEAAVPREDSKKAVILELLRQDGGATLAEIAASTGWQNHSIRGFVSGHITKKMGLAVSSAKHAEGLRRYQIT